MRSTKLLRTWPARVVLLYAFWLLLVGSVKPLELVAGAVALVLALAGLHASRRQLPAYRLPLRLLSSLVRLPYELVRDTAVVLAAGPRRPLGRFRSVELRPGRGPEGRAVQAFAELRGSLAPNAIVVDVDADAKLALLHELDPRVPGRPL